jgi:2-C-methyl-D-erythritol 4-phosphate cytidylyltransferase|tara:strand:- start:410 stop:955 length:546 start_codon:yes stop_codon:yes gene_type:complete
MKRVLIFGSNSTLAKKIKSFLKNDYLVTEVAKKKINFSKKNSPSQIHKVLSKVNPDIVINFAGVLGTNSDKYKDVYDVNFLPNWEIIKFYINNKTNKKVKIILIGSSSYKKGKANYMLYTSSKAALHNLYQAAKEKFGNTYINVDIFHPPRFQSKLIKNLKKKGNFTKIEIIAKTLFKKIK